MSDDEYFGKSFLDTFDDGEDISNIESVDISIDDTSKRATADEWPAEAQMDISELSLETPAFDAMIREEQQRIERALRGAIRAGYDGVDINRPPLSTGFEEGRPLDTVVLIESIVPWHRPEPDGANCYRTERYTWDWFSDDELTAILSADNPIEVLHEHD